SKKSFNNTPPAWNTRLFGFLHFMKSPAFGPFCSVPGDSSSSVCCCSPHQFYSSACFQARLLIADYAKLTLQGEEPQAQQVPNPRAQRGASHCSRVRCKPQ